MTQGRNKKKEGKERQEKSPLTYSNIFRGFSDGVKRKNLIPFKKFFNLEHSSLNTPSDGRFITTLCFGDTGVA